MYKKNLLLPAGLSQFFQLPVNVMLTQHLSIWFLRVYLYLLGLLYFLVMRGERERISLGIRRTFHADSFSIRLLFLHIAAMFGVFEHYLEKLVMAHKPLSFMRDFLGKRLVMKNRNLLDEMVACGKGGILVTGHFGAVEYLPLALAMNGYKIAMICRFKTSKLKEELAKRAEAYDVMIIDASEPKVAFRALDAIKKGRILVTECDEFSEWRMDDEERIQVFGHSVPLDRTLDFFYRRARVPVIMGLMRRDGEGFTLCIESLASGMEEVSLGRAAWKTLESYILRHPHQWYQWKDAVRDLAPFIDWGSVHADRRSAALPAGHPVPAPGVS